MTTAAPHQKTPFTPYQRRLFWFLSVASFFEGYDFLALTQILPNFGAQMGLLPRHEGLLVGIINSGTMIAYLLVRKADQWGRRRVLSVTIAGYTIFSVLTAFAPNVYVFAVLQLLARIFLLGEWAVSTVYAAEEYPSDRRGMVIGVIQAFSSLGSIVCAGVVPLLLATPYGWRSVYLVGGIPLVLIAVARRGLRETARFEQAAAERAGEGTPPFTRILRSPYRGRMLQLALIWGLTYVCTQNAVTFWKTFALRERGLSDGEVGGSITFAALASMPLIFVSGKLLDVVGRRKGAVIIYVLAAAGVLGAYSLGSRGALTAALVFAIFGASGVLPVLNAYMTELFPTHLRSDAIAWSNNLLGRIGYMLSPIAVGFAAEEIGWGPAVSATALFPLVALALILWLLPETRGKELEETARI
ncbi:MULTISPECIES: MFS transporter [Sorangium]|uniref:Permease of the major facilitator superfamily n=1 Tax=Sorangium cellulosum (strain So ce56) TaxID=448385 RepID=A9F842_SORC5|nr:MFS transporter [Sorangium cellulosum]CAN91597.1 permease of the major facilitator superfamily [Sorangium cellulosum So ce56]